MNWTGRFARCKQFNDLEKPQGQSSDLAATGKLSWLDLTAYGIAAVVGSGIFATVGRVAREDAGLAVPFSIALAGMLSLGTAICLLEWAGAVPEMAGSAYAYAYGMLGEAWAWAIGWNLTLEYAFAAACIAFYWSTTLAGAVEGYGVPKGVFVLDLWGIRVFPLAALLVIAVGVLVSGGLKLGARLTNAVSLLNIILILFIIAVGALNFDSTNWKSAACKKMPEGKTLLSGVVIGGANMLFAYIGYDTVSALAADAARPGRDLPLAVLLTLAIATVLYVCVAAVLTGMVPWPSLAKEDSLISAFREVRGAAWAAPLVTLGSLTTMAATVMACLIGQPKIFQAMAADGLLPAFVAGTFRESVRSTVALTALLALLVNFADSSLGVGEMINFGFLLGMSGVCAGLLVARFRQFAPAARSGTQAVSIYFAAVLVFSYLMTNTSYTSLRSALPLALVLVVVPFALVLRVFLENRGHLPSLSRGFSCPLMPWLPCLAVLANSLVMMSLFWTAIGPFAAWTLLGLAIYVGYGQFHSKLQ